jgi:ubiquinone/menaquinone biosynthesis C-methylase UbiE
MFDHFDWIAPIYDRIVRLPVPKRFHELLKLPESGTLLDAGGGTGRVASRLNASAASRLVVSDLSLPMLKQSRILHGLHAVRARSEQLPFADATFDRVIAVDAFHHFFDQRTAIREFVRVLKPEGRLVIEEPDRDRLIVRMLAVAEKMILMRSRIHSMKEILTMVAAEGMTACIERGSGFASWVIADKQRPF